MSISHYRQSQGHWFKFCPIPLLPWFWLEILCVRGQAWWGAGGRDPGHTWVSAEARGCGGSPRPGRRGRTWGSAPRGPGWGCQPGGWGPARTWTSSRGRTRRPAWTCPPSRGPRRPWAWPPCSWWRCTQESESDVKVWRSPHNIDMGWLKWKCELSILLNLIAFSLDGKGNTTQTRGISTKFIVTKLHRFHFVELHNPSLISLKFYKIIAQAPHSLQSTMQKLSLAFSNLKYGGINHQEPWWVLIWAEMISCFKIELKRFFTRLNRKMRIWLLHQSKLALTIKVKERPGYLLPKEYLTTWLTLGSIQTGMELETLTSTMMLLSTFEGFVFRWNFCWYFCKVLMKMIMRRLAASEGKHRMD